MIAAYRPQSTKERGIHAALGLRRTRSPAFAVCLVEDAEGLPFRFAVVINGLREDFLLQTHSLLNAALFFKGFNCMEVN